MDDDPIIAEVRRIRDEIARRYNYDVRAMMDAACEQEKAHPEILVNRSAQVSKTPVGSPSKPSER